MEKRFFLQMSGMPGSGKSTLAKAIARRVGCVVVDHDVVKSALLRETGDGMDSDKAGRVSYAIEWDLINYYLDMGHNVILDSPCIHDVALTTGQGLAKKYGIQYKYVECQLRDMTQIDMRLRQRSALLSQNRLIQSREQFEKSFGNSKRPSSERFLIVDTSLPMSTYLEEVLAFVGYHKHPSRDDEES